MVPKLLQLTHVLTHQVLHWFIFMKLKNQHVCMNVNVYLCTETERQISSIKMTKVESWKRCEKERESNESRDCSSISIPLFIYVEKKEKNTVTVWEPLLKYIARKITFLSLHSAAAFSFCTHSVFSLQEEWVESFWQIGLCETTILRRMITLQLTSRQNCLYLHQFT